MFHKLRVVSDGTYQGTHVTDENGEDIVAFAVRITILKGHPVYAEVVAWPDQVDIVADNIFFDPSKMSDLMAAHKRKIDSGRRREINPWIDEDGMMTEYVKRPATPEEIAACKPAGEAGFIEGGMAPDEFRRYDIRIQVTDDEPDNLRLFREECRKIEQACFTNG